MTRSGKRILAVFGSLLALVATGSLLAGTALFFVHVSHRGENGFFTTPSAYISAGTHALTSAETTLGAIPGEWVPSSWLSTVQVSVSPTGNTPVFVGIGPESQVDSYLEGVAVAEITKIESDTHYLTNAAIQREISPAPPSEQTFWATSAEGHGSQTVVWDLEPGQWKVVIMNADASRDISVEMFTGARTAWSSVSIIALSAGGLVLAAGAGLALLGVQTADRLPLIVTTPPKP